MNYVALYRKYRPQTFDEVIGQDNVITTLKNQIIKNKVSHAYLFTGTRGTGKTSTAKIFARAINCTEAANNGGNPCGKCSFCSLSAGSNMDVIEMDAASNNGVDYARDIREKVQYPPVNGRYKVYIIDEVHMLSQGAFNALLKTLEEPPEHAVFILCTTEVHKIPATILSRCMRFDFKLVPTATLAEHIKKIYDAEGKKYSAEAVLAIARAGEGSVRDAVSIADRCFALDGDELTYKQVMDVLGVSSSEGIFKLADAVLGNDTSAILTVTDQLVKDGKDVARLSKDLSLHFRDVLTVKECSTARQMLGIPQDEYEKLQKQAESVTATKLIYAIETLVALETQLRYALSPVILFQAAELKIASSSGEVDYDGLNRRLTRLEQQPHNLLADQAKLLVVDQTNAQSIWRGVKVQLETQNEPLLSGVWKDVSVELDAEGNFVVLCRKGAHLLIEMQFKKRLIALIGKVTSRSVVFKLVEEDSQHSVDNKLKQLGTDVKFE